MKKIFTSILIFILIFCIFCFTSFSFLKAESKKQHSFSSQAILTPSPQIVFSQQKNDLKGKATLEIRVENALNIEVFVQKVQSLTPIYLGKAEKIDDQNWKFLFDTTSLPNGSYYLFLEIENPYGKYQSNKIELSINNIIEKDSPKEQGLKQIIQEKEKELLETQKELESQTQKTHKEILQTTQKTLQEIIEVIPEKEQQKVRPVVQQNLQEVAEQVSEKLEQFKEKKQEEIEMLQKIEKKLQEKKSQEAKIQETQEKLQEISQKVFPKSLEKTKKIIQEEKNQKIQEHQKTLQKIEKEIEILKERLDQAKKEKTKVIHQIEEDIEKVVVPISEKIEKKKLVEEKVSKVKKEVSHHLSRLEEIIEKKEKERLKKMEEILKDTDQDGLPDKEEIRLGTDPLIADSDGDGYLDGIEIKTGFDPLDPSPADKIVYQTPEKTEAPISEKYKIEKVERVILKGNREGLKIIGKGVPNTFVTIYVYSSEPLILVTKTDEMGNFVYILDKPLSEGPHRIYVAITNNKGEIVERSEAFHFIKTPTAIAAVLPPVLSESQILSPTQSLQKAFTLFVISLIILGLGIAFLIIGLVTRKKRSI